MRIVCYLFDYKGITLIGTKSCISFPFSVPIADAIRRRPLSEKRTVADEARTILTGIA